MAKEKVSREEEQSFQVKHYTIEELIELFGDAFAKKKVSSESEELKFNDQIPF